MTIIQSRPWQVEKAATSKRKRVSKAPEERREELLEVASQLFATKGVAATGIAEITQRAEVARGTFYLYFTSKDDVVAELWRRYVAGFMAVTDHIVEEAKGAKLGAVVLKLLTLLTEHALENAHLHHAIYSSADAAAIALCRQSDRAILARLTEAISSYFASAGRRTEDANLVASLLFHGLDGALHHAIMGEAPLDRDAFLQGVIMFAGNALAIDPSADVIGLSR